MNPVSAYLAELNKNLAHGDASEHTHRPALQTLIEVSAKDVKATNEPRTVERENKPDYLVRRNDSLVGYIEAKDISKDLKAALKTEQLRRYCEALPNLILTNYVDFVWLAQGELRLQVSLGEVRERDIQPAGDAQGQWEQLVQGFLNEVTPTINKPQQLAQSLGGQTRLLRNLVIELVHAGDDDLFNQMEVFRKLLLPDLNAQTFADMYAQTATYGLFTARVFEHTTLFGAVSESLPAAVQNMDFSLEKSVYLIPKANPFLFQFFQHIASPGLNAQLRWLIEQIADSLRHVDMNKVLHRQGQKQGFEDPVFHFYETFLAEYDPALRESRGVYYTPEPVVDFIVRGVDWLLREKLGKTNGLGDKDTLILDPAAGTATFLRKVIEHTHKAITAHNAGIWPQYVHERLLPRLFGFELMMAPYTVAHLKLALQLQQTGFTFDQGERLNVFLTNTLDTIHKQMAIFMAKWITAESQGAEGVKRDKPVQVVLGNPPYSGESHNKSDQIAALMQSYKKEPEGGPLKERNSKWINDDYVKFIRFAHERIVRTGHGVVAFITNHGWLDNPTFRGMRASLMRDFDEIYVLDLHGNSKKKEHTPKALAAQGDDKNVFDIQVGVSIVFLLKKTESSFALKAQDTAQKSLKTCIYHHELWGSREYKYDWLQGNHLQNMPWQTLQPAKPLLLLVPRDEILAIEYGCGWKINEMIPINGTGIVTKCDDLNIHFTMQDCFNAIQWFSKASEQDARIKFRLPKSEVRDWKFQWAQQDIVENKLNPELVKPIIYRPFDTRYTYYTGCSRGVMGWPVQRIMRHLVDEPDNMYLGVCRQVNGNHWQHVFIGSGLAESCFISNKTREIGSVFPLYCTQSNGGTLPNLASNFLSALSAHGIAATTAPKDIFAYIYAVLHAPSYRQRYAEFLKSDFPRIPVGVHKGATQAFPAIWQALQPLGHALINLHLLKKVPGLGLANFPVAGSNTVEKPRFETITGPKEHSGRVWINATQYFDNVPKATWTFRIGGYQVCEKWLKDRKGRTLKMDDLEHYRHVVAALKHTPTLMAQIDAVVNGQLWPYKQL